MSDIFFCNPADRLAELNNVIYGWRGKGDPKNTDHLLATLLSEYHRDNGIDIFREMLRHCEVLTPIIPSLSYDQAHAEWWQSYIDGIHTAVDALHLSQPANHFIRQFIDYDAATVLIGIGHAYRVRHSRINSIFNPEAINPILAEIDGVMRTVRISDSLKRQIERDLEKIRDIIRMHETHSIQSFAVAYNKVSQALTNVVSVQDDIIQAAVKKKYPKWIAFHAITFTMMNVVPHVSNLTTIATAYSGGAYNQVAKQIESIAYTGHDETPRLENHSKANASN